VSKAAAGFSFEIMKSPLQNFAISLHRQAAAIIGEEPIMIGGGTFFAVLSDQDSSLEFSDGRNEPEKRMTAVLPSSRLTGAIKINALVTARGEQWRLDRIDNAGGTFATLNLTTETKG
jgi:hypothetical protein